MNEFRPTWSPDGKRILFASDRNVLSELYMKGVDGLTNEQLTARSTQMLEPSDWSPDGRYAAIEMADPKDEYNRRGIAVLSFADGKITPFIETPFRDVAPMFSPDQHWLTYVSNESGKFELYAVPFPDRGEKRQLTSGGINDYAWRRDGKEIVVVSGGSFSAIPFDGVTFGTPQPLFKPDGQVIAFDVARDGRLIVATAGVCAPLPWFGAAGRTDATSNCIRLGA